MVDFNLNEGEATINSEKDLIILLIDLLFDTVPGDILGSPDYGTKYDKYLYNLKLSNSQLESIVSSDLLQLELFGYVPKVKVYLLEGSERDIALIQIDLYKDNLQIEKIYRIS